MPMVQGRGVAVGAPRAWVPTVRRHVYGLCSHSCLLSHVPRLAPCNAGVASLIKAGSREIFPVLFE